MLRAIESLLLTGITKLNIKSRLMDSSEEPKEGQDREVPKPERKVPEFIFIENDPQNEKLLGSTPHDSKQMFGSLQNVASGHHPFYLRILSLLGTVVMIFLTLIVFTVFLIPLLLSLLFLRQSSYLNEQTTKTWRSFKKALIFTLGCFVCTFNLSLGIGIVLMYFMLTGEKFNNRIVEEFTKRNR